MSTPHNLELAELLRGLRGQTAVTLETLTEPELRKKSEAGMPYPHGGTLRKRTRLRAVLNADYAAAVNARRVAEGKPADFAPSPRKWGTKVAGTPLVEHKGQLYVEYQAVEVLSIRYELDGRSIEAKALEPWLPASRSQAQGQGVDDQVAVRTVKLENVAELALDGGCVPAA
jgi:NifB/MoaA-like Fe-S oxidoreductase